MKRVSALLVICIYCQVTGCSTTATKETHMHCVEEGYKQVAYPYCCEYGNGYCLRTCYNYTQQYACLDWECDEGYQRQEIKEEDLAWWQFAGASECIPM